MNTLTQLQEVYFDLNDLANGSTYQSLGYTKKEWLKEAIAKLESVEIALKKHEGGEQ